MRKATRYLGIAVVCALLVPVAATAQSQGEWARVSRGNLPAGAFAGGVEGDPLYICRAAYEGGVHPGKLLSGACNIGWGGREIVLSDYEVLVDDRGLRWVPGPGAPAGSVIGGREVERPLYVCRAEYRSGTHPGKVVGDGCNIGWGGQEVVLYDYEVLLDRGDLAWYPGPAIPSGAIAAGWEAGRPLYVCRAEYRGGVHPGKVISGSCNIAWGGQEIPLPSYELLASWR